MTRDGTSSARTASHTNPHTSHRSIASVIAASLAEQPVPGATGQTGAMRVEIELLTGHGHLAPALAAWHHAEWGHLYDGRSGVSPRR